MGEIEQPKEPQQRPKLYLPLPRALETGRVDLDALHPHDPQYAGHMVVRGLIPDQAGTFELHRDRLAAYDVVDGEMVGDEFIVRPTYTTAVDKETRNIRGGSFIIQTFVDENIFKLIAELSPVERAEWNKSFAAVGQRALRLLGVEARIYEFAPDDVDPSSGLILGRQPRRYF